MGVARRQLTTSERSKFDHVPRALTEAVRIVDVPILSPGADAMTLGHTVLVRRGHGDSSVLLAHELVHVQQWSQLGVAGFLRRYLLAYAKNMLRLRSHHAAYLAIPLEVEARAGARQWVETHREVG